MEIKVLGQKLKVEIILICLLLGYILGGHLLCSCSRISLKEGLAMISGSVLDYSIGNGVRTSWENPPEKKTVFDSLDWYKSLEGNTAPKPADIIASGKLDILANNTFDPKCCPSTYTSSKGCACVSPEQMTYLNERGGNRTFLADQV
jgi:hypothetical protein